MNASEPRRGRPSPAEPTASPAAVVTRGVVRAAERLDLSNRVLAGVLGLSEATVSRMTKPSAPSYQLDPDSKPYELAVLFLRLYRSLDALVDGDMTSARAWLRNDNTALGRAPLDHIGTVAGLVNVVAYLDSRRGLV
jgi:hypothetical protein